MKPENVPQQWRNLIIGAIHEALDDNMLALHYVDIERMVDEGLAVVAPLIAAAERERCARMADGTPYHGRYRTWPWWANPDGSQGNRENESDVVRHADAIAAAIRALT